MPAYAGMTKIYPTELNGLTTILHAGTKCAFAHGHKCPCYKTAPDESGLQPHLWGAVSVARRFIAVS